MENKRGKERQKYSRKRKAEGIFFLKMIYSIFVVTVPFLSSCSSPSNGTCSQSVKRRKKEKEEYETVDLGSHV